MKDFKMPFEDIDEDLIENRDQEISTAEKTIITIALGFIKLITWRVKRAKTYGDLYNIVSFFRDKYELLQQKYEYTDAEEANAPSVIMDELSTMKDQLEEENEEISQNQPKTRFQKFMS